MNYEIFLDESGLFLESSSIIDEQETHVKSIGRKFPSQIAGVVAGAGVITSGSANTILRSTTSSAGIEYGPNFHANEHVSKTALPKFVSTFCDQLKSRKIQPVRLVNAESIPFGDRVSTYCNILAELLVRVCQQLEREGESMVSLNVFAAKVVSVDDATSGLEFIEEADYLARIRELFGRAAIANGFNATRFKWKVDSFQIRSARDDRRLQLADVVSYVSHDDFWPLKNHVDVASTMRSVLSEFDWTFSFDETLSNVRDLMARESYAPALIALAERATAQGIEPISAQRYENIAGEVVAKLESIPPAMLKSQFQMIAGWLNQVAEQRHDLDSSLQICQWIQRKLCDRQGSKDWPADWLRLITDTWALTACNHDANTIKGRAFADRIDAVVPKLASRWEYADDLMLSFIVRAVHQNDCFEHQAAAERMASVVGYYESLDGFFADAFKGVFPEKVLSDMRARALGTGLQSQVGMLLTSNGDLNRCREISDQAISEFQHAGDRSRQWQYRCELETIAGNWPTAREYLAKSLCLNDCSHETISDFLSTSPDDFQKAFTILHWTRIGSMAAATGNTEELSAFINAFERTKLKYTPWCNGMPVVGKIAVYPSHGILRHLAVAYAGGRDLNSATEYLRILQKVVEAKPRPIFQLIQIAAQLQCAGLLLKSHAKAFEIVSGGRKHPDLLQLIAKLSNQVGDAQLAVKVILQTWRSELESQAKSAFVPEKLLQMGRIVGY